MIFETRNPTTEKVIQQYETLEEAQVEAIIQKSEHSFAHWRNIKTEKRADYLYRIAALLRQRKQDYAILIAEEMGKPINDGQKEIEKCAWVCEYYAENAEKLLEPQTINTEYSSSSIHYQPLGIIFAIMPWNFPFWQVFRFAAPNLMAGNVAILRHAENTTGCGLAIAQLFLDAGFPEYTFQTVVITHETAEFIIKHPLIRGVTLTGSPNAGRSIASQAGQAIKKVVLELGGNDPYLILKDADLVQAANVCVQSRLFNSGQVCIAAKRIIVEEAIYDEFQSLVLEELRHYTLGDPLDSATRLGPLARADLRETVHQQVLTNLSQGAQLIVGGVIPTKTGVFYPPTVIGNVTQNMAVMREEIFGPVITLIPAKNLEEAIRMANDHPYGLAAAIFTRDIEQGRQIAIERLHAGTCNVNTLVSSDPRLPFGGIKDSGYGRELGLEGLREFVNIKTVCIK